MWDDISERFVGGEAFTLDIDLVTGKRLERCGLIGMYGEGLKVDHRGTVNLVPYHAVVCVAVEDL